MNKKTTLAKSSNMHWLNIIIKKIKTTNFYDPIQQLKFFKSKISNKKTTWMDVITINVRTLNQIINHIATLETKPLRNYIVQFWSNEVSNSTQEATRVEAGTRRNILRWATIKVSKVSSCQGKNICFGNTEFFNILIDQVKVLLHIKI